MATKYQFQQEVRPELLAELVAAGFPADTRVEFDGDYSDALGWHGGTRCWVTTEPERFDAAAAVVAAHNPAVYDTAAQAKRQQFLGDVAGLRAYQNLATPTAADTVKAVRAQSRILARIVAELRD
jgi:hypothetical protein